MATITFGLRTDSLDHPLVGRALALSREFMYVTSSFITNTHRDSFHGLAGTAQGPCPI